MPLTRKKVWKNDFEINKYGKKKQAIKKLKKYNEIFSRCKQTTKIKKYNFTVCLKDTKILI